MVRRTFQEILKRDPAYGGTFGDRTAEDKAGPASTAGVEPSKPVTPGPVVQQPEPRSFQKVVTVEAREPAVERATKPVEPTSQPAPTASRRRRPLVARQTSRSMGEDSTAQGAGKTTMTVRLRPLARQVDQIAATGLSPHQVIQAAWRKAAVGLSLSPTYVEPSPEPRAGLDNYFTTTWRVDGDTLAALAQAHDPLGVAGSWFLIRGQVEPVFWQALDDMLAQLAQAKAGSAAP